MYTYKTSLKPQTRNLFCIFEAETKVSANRPSLQLQTLLLRYPNKGNH